VELGLVDQRLAAVKEVLDDGATVTDVARRHGVARQTVHEWLRRYAQARVAGADRCVVASGVVSSSDAPAVEVRIVELRRQHPGWGHARSGINPPRRASRRCRAVVDLPVPGPGLIVPEPAHVRATTTGGGSARGRLSCGRWTSSAGFAWPTGPSPRSCQASTTTNNRPIRSGAGAAPRRAWSGCGDGVAGGQRSRGSASTAPPQPHRVFQLLAGTTSGSTRSARQSPMQIRHLSPITAGPDVRIRAGSHQ
jgi:hypothetical protein